MANIEQKYAKALFDVALDTNTLEEMYEDFSAINESVQPYISQFKAIDQNPQQTNEQRHHFVGIVFGGANKYLYNMFMVLANNRHLSIIGKVFEVFNSLYNKYYNQDTAVVESVYELSDEQLTQIENVIKDRTNLDKVMIENKINPSLIGGVRITVDTTVMDASIENELKNMKQQMLR